MDQSKELVNTLWDYVWALYPVELLSDVIRNMSTMNLTTLCLKYIPSGFCLYILLKNMYYNSRKRIARKKSELEEIQLEIQIITSKLGARNADFVERALQSRRRADRLRAVRARVREIIAADDTLRKILDRASNWGEDAYFLNSEEGQEFKVSLLEDDTLTLNTAPDGYRTDTEPSVRSEEIKNGTKNCQVKISRVTKVHKVACLKHYIKQKRMRRASKQALLKKKIVSIKKLMEDWNKSLSQVINSPHPKFGPPSFDVASQDSTGDYSKPNYRGSTASGSDHDMQNNPNFEEYNQGWCQNSYSTCAYDDDADQNEGYELQGYADAGDGVGIPHQLREVVVAQAANTLFILPEETSSELAMETINKDNPKRYPCPFGGECQDYVAV